MNCSASFVAAMTLLAATSFADDREDLTLAEIRVQLVLGHSGALSRPISEREKLNDVPSLSSNVNVQANGWVGPSGEMYVDVVTRGVPGGYFGGRRVELEVSDAT